MRGNAPFEIKGIDHILVLVRGMNAALDFYRDALGCTIESRLEKYSMAELRAGAGCIDIVDIDAPEGGWAKPPVAGGRNVDHFALDLDCGERVLRTHLSERGVPIEEERLEGRRLSLYVRDPSSGTQIELICTAERAASLETA
jgi:glyoxylase I family protein